jgi:hypothetical protein
LLWRYCPLPLDPKDPVLQVYYRPRYHQAPLFRISFLSPSAREVLDLLRVRDLTRQIVAALPSAFTSFCSPSTFFTPTLAELAYDQPGSDATFEEMLGILEVPGARSFRFLPHKRYLRLGGRTSPVFVRLYHKVEHHLQLTRLEVVLRKPRLQALGVHGIDDLFRLDPAS